MTIRLQRRLVIPCVLLLVGSLTTVCAVSMYLLVIPSVSISTLRSQVEAELPLGTSRSRVESWLESQKLSWCDIIKHENGQRVGICGTIPHIYRLEFFGESQIDFEFYFDSENRLIELFLDEFTISL